MTESADTTTNYLPSDNTNNDNPIDLYVISRHRHEQLQNDFGLLDDDSEDNLTILDLRPIRKSDYDLSIFDELVQQCDAVLCSSIFHEKPKQLTTATENSHPSNLMATTLAGMSNDYQRRFQCSLQKLNIPSWYNDSALSFKKCSKPAATSASHYSREVHRTPEIVHVQRPHSYRSYRSSKGTSPSPSIHSWHPQHMIDGMNFSPLLPSSSTSTSRRHHHHQQQQQQHEKGIERVSKSSHWYQPTQFVIQKRNDQISTSKKPSIRQVTSKSNYYDIPKRHYDDQLTIKIKSDRNHQTNIRSNLHTDEQIHHLMDDTNFADVKSTSTYKNNNRSTDNHSLTNDKQHDNQRISLNGSQTMSLADEKLAFGRVELEDVTDEEENDKRPPTNNIHTVEEIDDDKKNMLLERLAIDLVDSILNDVLHFKEFQQEPDIDADIRELSDDENALRELDENDVNGPDEFIVFSTKAEALDDSSDQPNQISTSIPRGSLNRLYTFSRSSDDGTAHSKQSPDQESPASTLMIADNELLTTNSLLNTNPDQLTNNEVYFEQIHPDNSLPIYRSHIQKRHINLGRYYDGMMRAGTSQIPTHDLRCNLFSNNIVPHISTDGITEETVRQARLLLNSIPNDTHLNRNISENTHEPPPPIRSILKNTRFALTDEFKPDDHILRIEEDERASPRRLVTTTVTEEYRRVQRKTIEDIDESNLTLDISEDVCRDSGYSSNQERSNIHQTLAPSVLRKNQSPYELLSDCYSGYSYIRSDFLVPTKSPLISIISSIPSTTDEAYESEQTTTTSPRSPTMSSSTATTHHIHPDLEHEFEYPSPPPPVPDRRLKPAHLRPPPPPTKPRTHIPAKTNHNATNKIKTNKPSPLEAIQHIIESTTDDSTSSTGRTLSSRHYCGSIPLSNELTTTSSTPCSAVNAKTDDSSKENSKTINSGTSTKDHDDNQKITFTRPSLSSLNMSKINKKPSSAYFDETTNGLAIRISAASSDERDSGNKQNLNRIPKPKADKSIEGMVKNRPMSENLNSHRSSIYETSV
ncbi:unnamed protein product [Adineta ricciae]|uniref:Uncharacterized protein n=1 Tax=Adineta ricciae TaxID=249248 RepID=A0A815UQB7_ADIRI|nr:unnamed protein product [Adineta ricciae]